MNILYDDNMPYASEYFKELGVAKPFSAGNLQDKYLATCEALLVRSTTPVNAELLKKAPNLRYVATATAGFNHLSLADIEAANIRWYAAGGCNARAVAEYVLATLYVLAQRQQFQLQDKTIAIVGVGNVGKALENLLSAIDVRLIKYDPPRAERDPSFQSANFDDVLKADVISLHTPLISKGPFPTAHMFNAEVINKLNNQQILINASRGEVIDNQALLKFMLTKKDKMPTVCLDCWEHEPNIDRALIPYLDLATAHIAGHSLEGKAKGTDMVYQDLCGFMSVKPSHELSNFLPAFTVDKFLLENINALDHNTSAQTIVSHVIKSVYDIENDDSFFRRYMAKSTSFSDLRRHYPIRREWPAAKIAIQSNNAAQTLTNLGFRLANDSK